jgi:hypothetical protein
MAIIFEGDPPYDLPIAQSAEARSVDETVELTLRVSVPGKRPSPAPIRVQMTAEVARALSAQLQPAATMAELQARK